MIFKIKIFSKLIQIQFVLNFVFDSKIYCKITNEKQQTPFTPTFKISKTNHFNKTDPYNNPSL